MIRFDHLESSLAQLQQQFANAKPFHHVVIDDFADADRLQSALAVIPQPETAGINKSRDYIFAKNKYEKSNFKELSPDLETLYQDLVSERFVEFLKSLTGEDVFVDPEFFGGGVHQGGPGSFLDMHADFNYHPLKKDWFRNLNILLYLNQDWKPEYGGQLKLRHAETGEAAEVAPLFNRCVIMFTRAHTLHGYAPINFPEGTNRRSIAAYAYSEHGPDHAAYRSTLWVPEGGSAFKRLVGRNWPRLVRAKNLLFGVGTKKNQ